MKAFPVEYFQDDLRRFGRLWDSLGRPPLRRIWRDPAGGWIRWIEFTHPETGAGHRLFVPGFWRDCPKEDRPIIVALVRLAKD